MKEIERICLAIYQSFSTKCTFMWSDENSLNEAYKRAVKKIQTVKECTSDFGKSCCKKTLEKLWVLYFNTISQT
jgi:uncharacterized protein YgiB involved in biofilm formation